MTDDVREKYRDDLTFATDHLRADLRSNYESAVKFADAGIKFGVRFERRRTDRAARLRRAFQSLSGTYPQLDHRGGCGVRGGPDMRGTDQLLWLSVGNDRPREQRSLNIGHGGNVRSGLQTATSLA